MAGNSKLNENIQNSFNEGTFFTTVFLQHNEFRGRIRPLLIVLLCQNMSFHAEQRATVKKTDKRDFDENCKIN
jgi:hypothetical protein